MVLLALFFLWWIFLVLLYSWVTLFCALNQNSLPQPTPMVFPWKRLINISKLTLYSQNNVCEKSKFIDYLLIEGQSAKVFQQLRDPKIWIAVIIYNTNLIFSPFSSLIHVSLHVLSSRLAWWKSIFEEVTFPLPWGRVEWSTYAKKKKEKKKKKVLQWFKLDLPTLEYYWSKNSE